MAANKDVEVQNPRKLTLKVIMGGNPDVEKLLAVPGKRIALCNIYGVATRAKPGQSDLGPYVAFLGQFRGTNLDTGEIFESSKMILPKFVEEQLFAALPEGGGNVEFAMQFSAKYDKDAASKYIYEAKSLLPTQENAQLAALESKVKEAAKLLADKSKS